MIDQKAIEFQRLHTVGNCFIMANAWNAGSAILLQQAGVTRISIDGSLARATLGLVRRAAREMLEQGSFNFASEQIPDAELCKLFSVRADS